MDYVQVAVAVGLMALGGALVAWPMWLLLGISEGRVRELEGKLEALRAAGEAVVKGEREISAARALPAADRVGLLLDADRPPAGGAPSGPRRVS